MKETCKKYKQRKLLDTYLVLISLNKATLASGILPRRLSAILIDSTAGTISCETSFTLFCFN